MNEQLTAIENDFIEFSAGKTGKKPEEILKDYLQAKVHFSFNTKKYKNFCAENYLLHSIFYGDQTDKEIIAAYQHHALMHLYRFLSYSFPKQRKFFPKVHILLESISRGDFKKISSYTKKIFGIKRKENPVPSEDATLAKFLLERMDKNPKAIVDYGCGPAYLSFAIAQEIKQMNKKMPEFILVDIPSIISDFVLFRFKKHGIPVSFISISEDELYPKLPQHDLCLITEVMEHIKEPLIVARNIDLSLNKQGMILGNFEDHDKYLFHVSPNLQKLRTWLDENKYKTYSEMLHIKN